MTQQIEHHIYWFWQWECHGLKWQLIPSTKFPGRGKFHPICPVCKQTPERKWIKVER